MSRAVSKIGNGIRKARRLWLILSSTTLLVVLGIVFAMLLIVVIVAGNDKAEQVSGEVSAINISPEVERYRLLVEIACRENGIPECIDVILAMIMQESGGGVPDVMQSSESMGMPPNTISDPAISIQAGVKYFAAGYKRALAEGKKSPKETAIQGYNFGAGFIPFAIKSDGGWTAANAVEFARIQSHGQKRVGGNRDGQWAYGDQLYVQHVMAYLQPNTGAGEGTLIGGAGSVTVEKAISTGSTIVGKSPYVWGGGRSESDVQRRRFDCSSFVRWCYAEAGVELGPLGSTTTDTLVKQGKMIAAKDMKRGDIVFFDTYKVNGHVGIYLGDGNFINDNSSHGVWIDSMDNVYWKSAFKGVVRRITE
ncbi:bifunctional lytic transglycosylase/C40 family peptidase [Listeria newyorkensis]|uniref:bifunctional lytic transglycosylase/C40 family peptidase n=1 Tax=Listeria newyorkensis TaxID=1497681 RepID=UPI00051D1E11|nr:bifunctional lytic transglycosylase/C40 family peptidase [Listeria newyorkensis]KGL43614.1 lytic transglycosylase [Listeria newyorkensis]